MGAFVFISFPQTDAFGSFSIMRLGWRHWHFFSFFVHIKNTQETSFMSFVLPEINRRINEMQNKMKVRNFSEQEKRSWNEAFLFSPGMCWIVCYRQTMQRECECEWSFRTGIMENGTFHFSLIVPGSIVIICNYTLLSFPLMREECECPILSLVSFSCVVGFNLWLNAAKSFNIGRSWYNQ